MLPFLRSPRQQTGVIVQKTSPEGLKSDDSGIALESCAEDFHNASKSGNFKGMAAALRAAFEILESESHKEGSNTYESQNELAAKEGK